MPEKISGSGTDTNEGIQQYYISKIEELQVRQRPITPANFHSELVLADTVREAAECPSPGSAEERSERQSEAPEGGAAAAPGAGLSCGGGHQAYGQEESVGQGRKTSWSVLAGMNFLVSWQVHPEGKFVVDLDKSIEMTDVQANCRVALKNDSYKLHKILPNKVVT